MKKFEEIYAPATEPITIANNANQALLKNHREWREAFHAVKVQNRELVDENKEFERENQRLRAENLMENAKKQQPEIPEVPQFVADWYKENKNDLEYGIYSIHVDISDTSREEMSDIENWFNSKAVKSIETIFAMKRLGYTVAKEKRFYLKHIDFCKRHKDYDWYMIKHSDGPLNHLRVEKGTLPPTVDTYFTKQEIDSMETGSYELVPVEDGE